MKLSELLQPWTTQSITDCEILGLHNDSRQIKTGDLFIAYPGAATDGRLYIDKAVLQGAIAIVYDPIDFPPNHDLPKHLPCVPINHLLRHLAAIAKRFYNNPGANLEITAVTGTNGKTSIAYQLAQAHQLLGQKSAYIGTIGQGMVNALQPLENTTPDALCLISLLHNYKNQGITQVCMEVSSHALSQHRVDALDFKQALFTNLTLDHLDYHHTMEEYCAAKAQLFARKELDWAIVNQDDSYKDSMLAALLPQVKTLTYGIHKDCDVRATDWHIDIHGTTLFVQTPFGSCQIKTQALGLFNIYNSLAIFSSLLAFGYPMQEIIPVMAELKAAPGRMELVVTKPYVLVDYAHTPDALENVLSTLSELKQGKLWVVFGCGGDRDKSKRPLMGRAAALYADKLIITSDNPRSEDPQTIIEEIAQGVLPSINPVKIINREEAIAYALKNAVEQDIIIVAGKGHESYQQIGHVKQAFSDQAVIKKIMTELMGFPRV